jgi:uracil-DNA glycosylase
MHLSEDFYQKKMQELPEGWRKHLEEEFAKKYLREIFVFLEKEKKEGKTILPPEHEIFNAFKYTPAKDLKAVILGQDPYHGLNQAHGLCFSVRKGIRIPPSLINIFKEISNDLKIPVPEHGELTHWAKQGVLLLNAMLSVIKNEPDSHKDIGWQEFTNTVIEKISENYTGIVFMLWGKFAQEKSKLIDEDKHFILKASHPSPHSAYNGFFACSHFSKCNEILKSLGKKPIEWGLEMN